MEDINTKHIIDLLFIIRKDSITDKELRSKALNLGMRRCDFYRAFDTSEKLGYIEHYFDGNKFNSKITTKGRIILEEFA